MASAITPHPGTIAALAGQALPGAQIDDLLVAGECAGLRWTRGEETGLSLLRFEGELLVQSWSAARHTGGGPWPNAGVTVEVVPLAIKRAAADRSSTHATMERYFAIRADVSRADELREMFREPMVVHGPGPTRVENLDEFVVRVKSEKDADPLLAFRADGVLCAGDRALLRWSYLNGEAVAAAGLTLYALDGGVVAERWQTSLREGVPWM